LNIQDAIKAKGEELGVEIIETDGQGKAENQISQVENFITQKVDAIILNPFDKDGCAPAVEKAVAANIPVIVLGMDGGKGALQEIADGNMSETSAFDFNIMASEGLKLAIAVATGEQKDPVYDITTNAAVMIDSTNVKEYLK
jgi:ABC-type sugar transport system substrate-binding protein